MPIADLINNVFCERAVHSTGDEHSITLDEFKGSMKSKLGELLDCCWLPSTAAGCRVLLLVAAAHFCSIPLLSGYSGPIALLVEVFKSLDRDGITRVCNPRVQPGT